MGLEDDRQRLRSEIERRLRRAAAAARRYRRWNTVLMAAGITLGLAAAALAGNAALGSKALTQPVAAAARPGAHLGDLAPGWRLVCGIIGAFTFLGTLANALASGFKVAEGEARARAAAGALDGLRSRLLTTGALRVAEVEETRAAFARVLTDYAAYVGE